MTRKAAVILGTRPGGLLATHRCRAMKRQFHRSIVGMALAGFSALVACRDVTAPTQHIAPAAARLAVVAAPQPVERLYGPERFARTQGPPNSYSRTISTVRFEAPFTIHIRNGAADGSQRAFGGDVTLDGKRIVSQQDFARQREWALPVALGTTATLEVSLAGAPGGYLEIWIEGKRSYPVFCPNGPAGSYPTLPEAVAAVWIGGTVLVCDGEHRVDLVFLNKPLTLRSQNSGGATLADADASQVYQGGRPALVINGVEVGGVRIADLNFSVGNRAIFAGGTFDQVEIDSVHFRGRSLTVPIGVWVAASTVGSAKVDVTRSRFEGLMHAVFPVRAVETNVSWSQFDSFGGGAVTYSGATLNGVASASYGRIAHNTFTRCALPGCIRVVGPPQPSKEVVIAHNVMTRATGPTQAAAIVVSRISASSGAVRAPVIVEHNQIAGAVLGTGPSWENATWSVAIAVQNLGGLGGTPVVLRNNRIRDVHTAISASAAVTATDNFLVSGARAITQQDPSVAVDFQRNDVTFETSIFRTSAGGHQGNYRCNWWGSASGPPFPNENVRPSSYTPWATQPVANTGVECDPTPPAVVRVCAIALEGGPITFPTLAIAYDAVATGGTVLFCDGTHVVQDVRINRAITIRSEGPAKAMLDAGGALSTLEIRDATGGPVEIRSLRFRGAAPVSSTSVQVNNAGNVRIGGTYSAVIIEDSDFEPSSGVGSGYGHGALQFNAGILINQDARGGSVTVRRNSFTGGDIGVTGYGAGVTITENRFRQQSFYPVYLGLGGATIVSDNDIRECGAKALCIAAHDVGSVSIVRNHIEVGIARPMPMAILVDAISGDVSDNIIVGIGGEGGTSFPITRTAIAVHATNRRAPHSTVTLNRNVIGGAAAPFEFAVIADAGALGSTLDVNGSNNIASRIGTAITGSGLPGAVALRMNRNDFTGYLNAYQGPALSSVALQCNWWGQITGPSGYFPADWLPAIDPVATEPIANNGGVACN